MNIPEEQKFKIGIIGHGFVGQAVEYGFTHPAVAHKFIDPKYDTDIDDLIQWGPNLVFICVPTPMRPSGRIDASAAEDAVLKVLHHTEAGVALKSTVTPDVIERILNTLANEDEEYLNRFCYNPEFLTERNSKEQFVNQPFIIVGGEFGACNALLSVYEDFSQVSIGGVYQCTAMEASVVKYGINSFLAMKTVFMNQISDLCEDAGLFYPKIMRGLMMDHRLGRSHMRVPGPDGRKGFGGACFPKDTRAFTTYSDRLTLLESVIEINDKIRADYELDEREKSQNVTYGKTQKEQ